MKKNQKLYLCAGVILFLILLSVSVIDFVNYREKNKENNELKKKIINNNIEIFDIQTRGYKKLNNVINTNKLIFRISKGNCSSCVEKIYILLKENHIVTDSTKLLIFANYGNINELKIHKFKFKIPWQTFCVRELPLIDEENLNEPYFFLVNSNLIVTNIFVPDINSPNSTKTYLKSIQKHFFNSDNKVHK